MKDLQHKDFESFRTANVEEFYGQLLPKEKKEMADDHKRVELIKKMPEYRKLDDGFQTLIKMSNAVSDS